MQEPITYKQVLSKDGSLTGLELWQNGQYITISLAAEGTHKNYYRWVEIKEIIDKMQAEARDHALKLAVTPQLERLMAQV